MICLFQYGVRNAGTEPANAGIAATYLEKYWLSEVEYQEAWEPLHRRIFDLNKRLPRMVFKADFEFWTLLGGCLFAKRDFEMLRACLQDTGDQYFVVIQDPWLDKELRWPYAFRMKYPVSISWEELVNGNYISTALCDLPGNNYYVFGDSGKWGKYTDNEDRDIGIIGFDKSYGKLFRRNFAIPEGAYCENLDYLPEEERMDLANMVPEAYRNGIG